MRIWHLIPPLVKYMSLNNKVTLNLCLNQELAKYNNKERPCLAILSKYNQRRGVRDRKSIAKTSLQRKFFDHSLLITTNIFSMNLLAVTNEVGIFNPRGVDYSNFYKILALINFFFKSYFLMKIKSKY